MSPELIACTRGLVQFSAQVGVDAGAQRAGVPGLPEGRPVLPILPVLLEGVREAGADGVVAARGRTLPEDESRATEAREAAG
jgi:hypothetical protein